METHDNRSAHPRFGIGDDRALKVLKFGGTSVGSVARLQRVVEIIGYTASSHRVVVVTSAASGVTDLLVEALRDMQRGAFSVQVLSEALWARYHVLATGLLRPSTLQAYAHTARSLLDEHVAGLTDTPRVTPALSDQVLALGERLAAPLLALALQDAGLSSIAQDAAPLIRTDDTFGEALVDVRRTRKQVRAWHAALPNATVAVVTGFIGSTKTALTTTLGRGGSDYSAALLAASLGASVMERWTDVDGLYTNDPYKNRDAQPLTHIRLEEAWAWNHAGRLGMHRKALDPLVGADIPVRVRSTAMPEGAGTWILPAGYEPISAVAS
jgi:aspartate kinase